MVEEVMATIRGWAFERAWHIFLSVEFGDIPFLFGIFGLCVYTGEV
jgi:hypothetical protein